MQTSKQQAYFRTSLLQWNVAANTRQMPWKGEKDPYRIWLSEIILQQTRVHQGLEYYNRFITTFPTVQQLAKAPEKKVFKLWEGLGYYTRCKNLMLTAKYIADELNGNFPNTYDEILALKGIGPYTAAAIGSFAFNLPHAVVDGNVFRVLARYFGIDTPTDSTTGKKMFTDLANQLLDQQQPGIYNQALMDFGAVICKPQLPLCNECVMKPTCKAYKDGTVQQLPVKEKSIKKRNRWLYYLVIENDGMVYTRKRNNGDIWENLYEFVLTEMDEAITLENDTQLEKLSGLPSKGNYELVHLSPFYKQLLTHQTIYGQFIRIRTKDRVALKGYQLVPEKSLHKLPFPKFILNYLKDKNVSLNLF